MRSIHQMERIGKYILGREYGIRKGLEAQRGGPYVLRTSKKFRVAGGYYVGGAMGVGMSGMAVVAGSDTLELEYFQSVVLFP